MKKIPLTHGRVAIVDDEDFSLISQYKWHLSSYGYAVCGARSVTCPNKKFLMHRLINKTPQGFETDHVNKNRLDNRRLNLRTATKTQNYRNQRKKSGMSSQYKGVSWNRLNKNWRSCIKTGGKQIPLGSFLDEKMAALAYDVAAREIFGEFASFNFPNIGLGRAKKMLK